jgi:multidrug efflux pump subunit AcrA (membrane-fusion protein)
VKAGQVIAKFDGETMRIQSAERRNEIASTQQDVEKKNAQLSQQQEEMNEDIGLISKEKIFAEKFSLDDIRVLSKLEILDSLQNSEYLISKEQYLNWTNDKFANKAEGERALITMKLAQVEAKLQQLTDNLVQLEIKAPHDGLLVYSENWRGEKPRVGEVKWPGMQIAKLPNINEMQLKLHVAESEAINLLTEQKVKFHLNAIADEVFTGKVVRVAPFAQTITKGNPLKFFEVIVSLDNQKKIFSPGKKVLAYIEVQAPSKKLVVPLQSVFSENNQSHVYLYAPDKRKDDELNDDFQQVAVTLGTNSLSHIEITSGLSAGQEIALFYQEND